MDPALNNQIYRAKMKFKFRFATYFSILFFAAVLAGFLFFPGTVPRTTNGSSQAGSNSVFTSAKTEVVHSTGPLVTPMSSGKSDSGRTRILLGVTVDGDDPLDIEELQEKVLLDLAFINEMNDGGTGQVDSTQTKGRMLQLLKMAATRPGLVDLMNDIGYISENYAKTEDLESKRKMVARLKECRTEIKKVLFQQVPSKSTSSNVGVSDGAAAGEPLVAPGEIEMPKTFQ